ncbi:MAG: response regulator transcription factor [Elusimicrobiales bacterium]
MTPKILIVEHEGAIRELYSYIFSELGYEVEVAGSGEEGLSKAERFLPDFMILASGIPGMTAYEFARRTDCCGAPGANIPFIVTTPDDCASDPLNQPFHSDPRCRGMLPKLSNPDLIMKMVKEALQA